MKLIRPRAIAAAVLVEAAFLLAACGPPPEEIIIPPSVRRRPDAAVTNPIPTRPFRCDAIDFWTTRVGPVLVPLDRMTDDPEQAVAQLRVRFRGRVVPHRVLRSGKAPLVAVYAPELSSPYSREVHFFADCQPGVAPARMAPRPDEERRSFPAGGRLTAVRQRFEVRDVSTWVASHRAEPGQDETGAESGLFPDAWASKVIRGGETYRVRFPRPEVTNAPFRVEYTLWGASDHLHHVTVSLNGDNARLVLFSRFGVRNGSFAVRSTTPKRAGGYELTVTLQARAGEERRQGIHFVRAALVTNDPIVFDGAPQVLISEETRVFDVALPVYRGQYEVWDVSVPTRPTVVPVVRQDGKRWIQGFVPSHHYVLFDPAKVPAATGSTKLAPASLAAVSGDLLVVAARDFQPALKGFLERRRRAGYRPVVRTPREVYQLYGHGLPGPAAIRAFVDRSLASATPARALLLIGDASPDIYRRTAVEAERLVPTNYRLSHRFAWVGTDLPYALDADTKAPELAVGRIPARSPAEVAAAMERGRLYEAALREGYAYVSGLEGIDRAAAKALRAEAPAGARVSELYLRTYRDDFRGQVAPAVAALQADLARVVRAGVKAIYYAGGGDRDSLSVTPPIVTQRAGADNVARVLTHEGAPPLIVTLGVEAGPFHLPGSGVTLGERLAAGADAKVGAAAVITAAAPVSIMQNLGLMLQRALTGTRHATVGDAYVSTVSLMFATAIAWDQWQAQSYVLLGDPTLPSPGALLARAKAAGKAP